MAEMTALEKELLEALELMTPRHGFPKCDRRCASIVASYDEDPRCDCGFEEVRHNADIARAVAAKARGTNGAL